MDPFAEYKTILYHLRMETLQASNPIKKRGPVSRGSARGNILLPQDLLDWAKNQPEGLSGLVRTLLAAERLKRQAAP